ncbi:MAG: type II toxin-antitoxin system HicA family toxin [Gammaproteobacteria bacterium]|nr:type II toxin-antitoxin system HicA family toxin [Gammaproteobacteria bacterium]
MNGQELLRRLRHIARQRNLRLRLVRERGKGSHATLYLGDRYTIMKDRKKEIGPGLLAKMLRDLGLNRRDIE